MQSASYGFLGVVGKRHVRGSDGHVLVDKVAELLFRMVSGWGALLLLAQ
jgi:hypothetical protein